MFYVFSFITTHNNTATTTINNNNDGGTLTITTHCATITTHCAHLITPTSSSPPHTPTQFSVKMVTADDERTTDIIVQGDEEEIDRMRRELDLNEKGMVKVKGILEELNQA